MLLLLHGVLARRVREHQGQATAGALRGAQGPAPAAGGLRSLVPAELAQIGALLAAVGWFCPCRGKRLWGSGVLRVRSAALAAANLAFIKAFFRALLKPFQM